MRWIQVLLFLSFLSCAGVVNAQLLKNKNPEGFEFLKDIQGEWDAQTGAEYFFVIVNDDWFQFRRGGTAVHDRGKIVIRKEQGTIVGVGVGRRDPFESFIYSAGPTVAAMKSRRKGSPFNNNGTVLFRARTLEELQNNGRLPVAPIAPERWR